MLKPASRIAHGIFGPMDFWLQLKSLMRLARMDGRTYQSRSKDTYGRDVTETAAWLTYEEWDHLFEGAQQAGIMAVYDDGNGEPSARFANPAAIGLLHLWRAIQQAKAEGIAPLAFAREYDARIEAQCQEWHRRALEDARKAAERREAAADDFRTRRNEKRKAVDFKQDAAGGL